MAANKSEIKFRTELVKCINKKADGGITGSTGKEIAELVVLNDKDL